MNIKTRPFTPAEFQTLIFSTPQPWKSIYLMAFNTGLRISDLLALKRKPCPQVIDIIEQKTHRRNTIKVTPNIREAWDYLFNYHTGYYLFPYNDISTYRKALVRHCRKCGINTDRIAFHSIRKTTATSIYRSLGFAAASQFLNHAKLSTTMHYIEMDAVEIGSALDATINMYGISR